MFAKFTNKSTFGFVFLGLLVLLSLMSSSYSTNYTLYGKIQNSTFSNVSANVSLYLVNRTGMRGEAISLVSSNNSNSTTGIFSLTYDDPGTPGLNYRLRVYVYNESNSSLNVLEAGPFFPEFPMQMLASALNSSASELTTITTSPAAIINITAFNSTADVAFSGILFDNGIGSPIDQFFNSYVTNRLIPVPTGKNYTIVLMMNDSGGEQSMTRSPPISFSVTDANISDNAGGYFNARVNATTLVVLVNGTLGATTNSTALNFSRIYLYPLVGGRVPLMMPPMSNRGVPEFNNTVYNLNSETGFYNMSVVGVSSGLGYLMLALASNNSVETTSGTEYFGCFQNITISTSNISDLNCTMQRLGGNYVAGSDMSAINTSLVSIRLMDTFQGQGEGPKGGMSEIVFNYSFYNWTQYTFFAAPNQSGYVNIPMLNGTNGTLRIYNSQFAPREYTFNSSGLSVNLTNFRPRDPQNLSRVNTGIDIHLFVHNSTCDLPQPDTSFVWNGGCRLRSLNTGDDGGSFNPLTIATSARTNVLIRDSTSGVSVYYVGVDMSASGPPDSDFSTNDNSTINSTSFRRNFRFGGAIPSTVYERLYVEMAYNDSLNDSAGVNVSMTEVFNDDWGSLWNSTTYPDGTGVPSAFADYNQSLFNTTAGGLACSMTNRSSTCFVNTSTNRIWLSLPHFSGSSPTVFGGASSLSSASSSSSSGSSSSRRSLSIDTSKLCPDNQLEVTTTSSGSAVSGITIRILEVDPYVGQIDSKSTDENGKATFVIPQTAKYEVWSQSNTYARVSPLSISWEMCVLPSTTPSIGTPAPSEVVVQIQPPPPAPEPQTPAPDPIAAARADATASLDSLRSELSMAVRAGKNVSSAQSIYEIALASFNSGDYETAKVMSERARSEIRSATVPAAPAPAPKPVPLVQPTPAPPQSSGSSLPLILGVIVLLLIGAGAYFLFGRSKTNSRK
ncbi:hypothetical protein HY990_03430 [Candidatus Micrarchaeota archaeon]|nr:hypothetical protein [Candidatus Micrarchaeota archaeon]